MPVKAKPSLRYDLILDGAVRRYPDGREVCCDTPKGKAEYHRRIGLMALRQRGMCFHGAHGLRRPTFDHIRPRGMGAGFRDDRIEDEHGKPMNCAACWMCNTERGSKR